MVMVKPAGPYLDILAKVADAVDVPVAAYQISGEYAMIEAAAEKGWIDRDRRSWRRLTGIKRAGAQHDPDVLGDGGRAEAGALTGALRTPGPGGRRRRPPGRGRGGRAW